MWRSPEELIKTIKEMSWGREASMEDDFWRNFMDWLYNHLLPDFLSQFAHQVDEISDINPDLPQFHILAAANAHMVEFLGALSASVRIYDPHTEQMLSYGSYPFEEASREPYIPLEKSVAGEVVKSRRTYLVPNILEEDLYQDKQVIERKGAHSLMAVPLEIPRFFPHERDTVGVIQIYYPENNRRFSPLEIQAAEVIARRLSFIMARKKILSLYKVNEKKEAIVRSIFQKLGTRGGIKMKDVFNRIIPELADIINVQSCALFSVANDDEHVILEAGYPDRDGFHGIGKRFDIASEPAFALTLNHSAYMEESPYDMVTQSYVLVMDPQKSPIVSERVKRFAETHNINSILYVPLKMGNEISHFMTFDAVEQRQRYSEAEIEIFLFLGRELMKAQRLEHLDDILHDFKNPAIAIAGFARRLKQLLFQEKEEKDKRKIEKYLQILLDETSRLQEMALSIYHVGQEQSVNLTRVLRNRFEINHEAIKEQLKQNVTLSEGPFEDPLQVRCYPLHLERILDNLLNNATNAIPLRGGTLSIGTYREGDWAVAEITNTGIIPEEERLRLLEGEGEGRGLYITYRIIRLLKGTFEIQVGKDRTTTLLVRLPIFHDKKD